MRRLGGGKLDELTPEEIAQIRKELKWLKRLRAEMRQTAEDIGLF